MFCSPRRLNASLTCRHLSNIIGCWETLDGAPAPSTEAGQQQVRAICKVATAASTAGITSVHELAVAAIARGAVAGQEDAGAARAGHLPLAITVPAKPRFARCLLARLHADLAPFQVCGSQGYGNT